MTRIDDERSRISNAVALLPEAEREVYRLSAVDGLDHGAIAERLGIDVAEVEARLARAIVQLDRLLGAP